MMDVEKVFAEKRIDLDIHLSRPDLHGTSVQVNIFRDGRAVYSNEAPFPLPEKDVWGHSDFLARLARSEKFDEKADATREEKGTALFNLLFPQEKYKECLLDYFEPHSDQAKYVCLWIHSEDGLLSATPWEIIFNPNIGEFLALQKHISIVRSVRKEKKEPLFLSDQFLKILLAGTSPINMGNIHERAEIDVIRGRLYQAQQIPHEAVSWHPDVKWDYFKMLIQEVRSHILHVIAHGTESKIYFEDQDNRKFGILLPDFYKELSKAPSPRLLVLSVCFQDKFMGTNGLSELIHRLGDEVRAIVAMRSAISTPAAVEFSSAFYSALAAGDDVATAVGEGRRHLSKLSELKKPESMLWSVPVTYQNSSVVPFPLLNDVKIITAEPHISAKDLREIKDEIHKACESIERLQRTILMSTYQNHFEISAAWIGLFKPYTALSRLERMETSYKAHWVNWSNTIWSLCSNLTDMINNYETHLTKLLQAESPGSFTRTRREALEIGENLKNRLSKLDFQLKSTDR